MDWVTDRLRQFENRIACCEGGRAYSYADFIALIDSAYKKIPDERRVLIPISSDTTVEGLATLLAVALRGHIALPLPFDLPKNERIKMRQIAEASKLYRQLKSSGLVLFSSGTSGEPKGMLHNFETLLDRYQNVRSREDRCLLLLLIDHIGGLDSAFRCLFAGSTLIIPESRTPEAAAKAISKHEVNVLPASPTFLNLMLLNGVSKTYDLSSLEIVAYGAEAMPQAVLSRLAETFPKAQLQQKFGTSETGAVRIESANNESLFFRITDPDTEWKVADDMLWLKTPSRILGYLNAEEIGLEADGWYATGDLVKTDGDQICIIGRASALINVGGKKVHPAEIEAALNKIDGIIASRVFSQPDPITGNKIACEIMTSEDRELRTWKREIRSHFRDKLEQWKLPTTIEIVSSIGYNKRLKRQKKVP